MRKLWGALFLASVLALTSCTFITAGQAAAGQEIAAQIRSLDENYLALKATYDNLAQKITDIAEAGARGEIPGEEVASLIAAVRVEQVAVGREMDEIRAKAQIALKAWEQSQEGGASPWVMAGLVILNLLTGTKWVQSNKVLKGTLQCFGVVSRALDAATNNEAGKFVKAEIGSAAGVTSEKLKALHHAATDREI